MAVWADVSIFRRAQMAPLASVAKRRLEELGINALPRGILNVFGLRAFKQMVWPNALMRIAAVQDLINWPCSMGEKPRNDVSAPPFIIADINLPVTIIKLAAKPKPAIISLVNFLPKAFCERALHAAILT